MSFHSDGSDSFAPVPTDMVKLAGEVSGIQRPVYYKILQDAVSDLSVGIASNTAHI